MRRPYVFTPNRVEEPGCAMAQHDAGSAAIFREAGHKLNE